jgi:hypothetical protein
MLYNYLFFLGVATKTCDKTQELPLEECMLSYNHFPTIGVYTFSRIILSPKWLLWPKFRGLAHDLYLLEEVLGEEGE